MKIVNKIRLIDGSEHDSKERADRHLTNLICKEKIFEEMAGKNVLKLRDYFMENEALIVNTLQLIRELKEVQNQKHIL